MEMHFSFTAVRLHFMERIKLSSSYKMILQYTFMTFLPFTGIALWLAINNVTVLANITQLIVNFVII